MPSPQSGFGFGWNAITGNNNGGGGATASAVPLPQQQGPDPLMTALIAALTGTRNSAPTQNFGDLFRAARNDPQYDQNRSYVPGGTGASSPFTNGFFNSGAQQMSPEARAASQGRSATTQWAQLGGVPGVDPTKLNDLMGQMTPTPGPAATPQAMTSDPFFNRAFPQMWPEAMQGNFQFPMPQPNAAPGTKKPLPANPKGSPFPGFSF